MLSDLSKIVYWKNIATILLLLCFLKFSFLDNFGFSTPLNRTNFFLLLVALISLFVGASFIIMYFLEKEHTFQKIRKKQLLLSYFIGSSIGIIIGTYISFQTERPFNSLIFIFIAFFMFFYAKETNKKTLVNNFILAFLKPGSLIILWWMDAPLTLNSKQWEIFLNLEIVFIYIIGVSYVINFVNSVFIDLVNIKKDLFNNHRTLPIALGEKSALKFVFQISIVIVIAFNVMIFYLISNTFLPISLFIILILPQIYGCLLIKKAKNKKDYMFIIKSINIALLIGSFIIPTIAYSLKNVN